MCVALVANAVELKLNIFDIPKLKMRKHLPNKEFFIGKTLPSRPDIQIVELKAPAD